MKKVKFKFNLGDLLQDKVTGLVGVVMVRAEYSTGCHHYGLQQRDLIGGKEPEWTWLDQSRLFKINNKVVNFDVDEAATSGAFPSGPQG